MGFHISITRWTGTDRAVAVNNLARIFRLSPEQGDVILTNLRAGNPWRFTPSISDQQAPLAKSYLENSGFHVELSPTTRSDTTDPALKTPPPTRDKKMLSEKAMAMDSTPPLRMGFHGDGFELFKIQLTNILLIISTFGIYSFWAKTKVRQYLYSSTSLENDRFVYHGTAKELFKGQAKFVGMILLAGLFTSIIASTASEIIAYILNIVSYLIFSLVFPVLMVGAMKYRLARTSLRGIRFSFRGKLLPAIILYIKGIVLTGLTLGLYFPFFMIQVRQFVVQNSYFGNMPFTFNGEGKNIFRKFLLMLLLILPTLGVYTFWYKAYTQSYIWSHTRIGGATFRFSATGSDWLKLNLFNWVLFIATFGIATPWVIVRSHKFIAHHLTLEGTANLDMAIQEMKNSGAIGDVALDDFDISLDAF